MLKGCKLPLEVHDHIILYSHLIVVITARVYHRKQRVNLHDYDGTVSMDILIAAASKSSSVCSSASNKKKLV